MIAVPMKPDENGIIRKTSSSRRPGRMLVSLRGLL